jgi:S-(hydroxymethyl)glutathione dehydrogenase/alcohol dehydrogenase
MRGRAALLWGIGEPWKVETIEIGEPTAGEVLVRWETAGLCHSEEHLVTGAPLRHSQPAGSIPYGSAADRGTRHPHLHP